MEKAIVGRSFPWTLSVVFVLFFSVLFSKTMLVYQNFCVLSEFIEYCNRKWVSKVFRATFFHYKHPQSLICHCLNQLFIRHPPPSLSSDPRVMFSARSCTSCERCAQLITWRHCSPHLNKWSVSFGPVPTASCEASATAPAVPPQEWKLITMCIRIGGNWTKPDRNLHLAVWSPQKWGLTKKKGESRCGVQHRMVPCGCWVGGRFVFHFFHIQIISM